MFTQPQETTMKRFIWAIIIAATYATAFCPRWTKSYAAETNSTAELDSTFSRFVSEKQALAETIARQHDIKVPQLVLDFFAAAQKRDWIAASNLFDPIQRDFYSRSNRFRLIPQPLSGAILDVEGTFEVIEAWKPEFLKQFGTGIVGSIPPGSIYFGGSEAGRFLVSVFSESHSEGRPFFTLTQNALSDGAYLGYVNDMYGKKINLPATNDLSRFVDAYTRDVKVRLEHDQNSPSQPRQMLPGENVHFVDGKLQFDGPVVVMQIHALMVRDIFEKNPGRQFFLEESYPLHWTFPYLTPHQFIFKLNRDPLDELSPEIVRGDREFWSRETGVWLGTWLNTNTPLREVAEFDERVYVRADLKNFTGDPRFIQDVEARKAFSHLRACIGGLYVWRADHAKDPANRVRMNAEAEFAFRQAFAICPSSREILFRYIGLLMTDGRDQEAQLIANVARDIDPEMPTWQQTVDLQNQINKPAIERGKSPGPP
jgi:hypothetical protein